MKKHIQYLLDLEQKSKTSLMWDRSSNNTIGVSNIGYNHQEHMDIHEALIKMGCRYDTSKPISEFDKTNGRTSTYFKEPKE